MALSPRWAVLLLVAALAAVSAADDQKPNFIVLFVDDWGYGDLGANWDGARGATPNMDKMAAEGMRFTDFHAGASVCTPSRAALLTGRLGLRTGVTHNFDVNSKFGLPTNETTIATALKAGGYRTGMIGKWHLGTTPGYSPTYHGFDQWLGLPYSDDMGCTDKQWPNLPLMPNCPTKQHTPNRPELALPLYHSISPNCSGQHSDSCNGDIIEQPAHLEELSDRYYHFAEQFISDAATGAHPFFLYIGFAHVHVPQFTSDKFANSTGRGPFFDSLAEVDNTIGRIIAAVEEYQQYFGKNNTLIFLTGDNGPWEVKCNLTGSVGPFKGQWQKTTGGGGSSAKMTLWEGGHREPGVAWWPGTVPANTTTTALSSTMDLMPTFLSLAGLPLPTDRQLDGIDLSPVLKGQSQTGHKALFHPNSGSGEYGQLDGVRLGNYKAIWQTGGVPGCGSHSPPTHHEPPLLFDLEKDPAETSPLSLDDPANQKVLQDIRQALADKMQSILSTPHSKADYAMDTDSEPCCNRSLPACRCSPAPGK
eukprot:m.91310 g.91310  ORF g.91310 m.91310 type:complete len:533 (+) comp8600_c0_seq3:4174-5772(+)